MTTVTREQRPFTLHMKEPPILEITGTDGKPYRFVMVLSVVGASQFVGEIDPATGMPKFDLKVGLVIQPAPAADEIATVETMK